MSCIYCNHYILYKLSDGYYKCAKCKRKFSPKKINKKAKILKGFLDELTPIQISKKYNISYASVVREITKIRKIIVEICEKEFLKKNHIKEFSEYLYTPKSNKNISKAQNFLTIDYGKKIYNILFSDMRQYQNYSQKEIENFFIQSQWIKIENQLLIQQFWDYFEKFILKFKGIKNENFIYYLKEAEFRFNGFKINLEDVIKWENF